MPGMSPREVLRAGRETRRHADDGTRQEMTGAQMVAMLPKASRPKKAGARYEFKEIQVSEESGNLVRAHRVVHAVRDRQDLQRAARRAGREPEDRRGVDGHHFALPVSASELSATMTALVAGVEPHLPITLDEETVLTSVVPRGPTLVYTLNLKALLPKAWTRRP